MQDLLEPLVDFSRRQTVKVDGFLSRSDEFQDCFIANFVLERVKILVNLPQCESEVNGALTTNDSIPEVAGARAGIVPLQITVTVLFDRADNADVARPSGYLRSVNVHSIYLKWLFFSVNARLTNHSGLRQFRVHVLEAVALIPGAELIFAQACPIGLD